MALLEPVPIDAAPPVPSSSSPEPTFDAQYEAFNTWERDKLQPQVNALAEGVFQNAQSVAGDASTAAEAAGVSVVQSDLAMGYRNQAGIFAQTATDKAAAADASATAASKLNLGDKAAPPTTDNQGQALRAGATYFDTSLAKWRVWTGSAWSDGISAVAGVSSFNGRTGAISDGVVQHTAAGSGVDLNTILLSGFYSFGTVTNGPLGVADSQLIVSRGGDSLSQIVVDKATGLMFVRAASAVSTVPVWSAWRRVGMHADVVVPLAGGAIDCAKGNYFTETVAGARTLAFSNIPTGSYSCVVEVTHTSGAITMPAGTVWANGSAPTLATGKRHLLFFQRAQAGTAGWYASVLPGYTT